MALGMSQSEADNEGRRGSNEGSKLAGNAALWHDERLENNAVFGESRLSAVPGGYRDPGGYYNSMGGSAAFWSSSESNSNCAWIRSLDYLGSGVGRYSGDGRSGFSVRCVRD